MEEAGTAQVEVNWKEEGGNEGQVGGRRMWKRGNWLRRKRNRDLSLKVELEDANKNVLGFCIWVSPGGILP